jgi:hypothetical protein
MENILVRYQNPGTSEPYLTVHKQFPGLAFNLPPGSGSAFGLWIRIRLQNAHPDQDLGGKYFYKNF